MKDRRPDEDQRWMEQALALATLASGSTRPNPRVGCVLVQDGRAVGRGLHRVCGGPHAEVMAIAEAGDRSRGATAYVNLEPCAHRGRTGPCADRLIEAGVRRVVASLQDPNPQVDGRGFGKLREAGVQVDVGCMADPAATVNAAFLHWHRTGRPLVTLKAALSLDGMLSAAGGRSRWITGSPARRFAHRLRLSHDAILVGAETVRRDDPRLTVRLAGVRSSPQRIVLSRSLDLDPSSRIFRSDENHPASWIYTIHDAPPRRRAELETVARVFAVDGDPDLERILQDIGGRGIQSLLVEGGGRTHGAFVAAGLAQRAALFLSDKLLGARGATPCLDLETAPEPAASWRLRPTQRLPLGDDLLVWGTLEAPPSPRGATSP